MPSGPKKRKAAKKKQVNNASSNSSSTSHSHHGESDGGELNSGVPQDQHNNEDVGKGEKVKNIEIDNWSKSMQFRDTKSSSGSQSSDDDESHAIENKVVELAQPVESLPEKIVQEVEFLGVRTSSVSDHVDSLLDYKNNNDTKIEEKTGIESVPVNNGVSNLKETVAVSTNNDADRINEPETLQYSDKQPLVASTPRPMQTVSWKGCCGILELFSRSE